MPETDGDGDLGERIAKAKAAQSSEKARGGRSRGGVDRSGGLGLRYSAEFASAIIVGVGLGLFIDAITGAPPWGLLVMLSLGFAAGIRNIVRAAKEIAAAAMEDTDEAQE